MKLHPRALSVAVLLSLPWPAAPTQAVRLEPVVYTMAFPDLEGHIASIEARFPTEGRASLDLMLPRWSPGFYGLGDYARNVRDLAARSPDGSELHFEKPGPNHWLVDCGEVPAIVVSYELECRSRFVTGSWVDPDYAVINGPSTFIALADSAARSHEVQLELPEAWPDSITSLEPVTDGGPHHYVGSDYDVFIDAPIVAGTISVHAFDVAGSKHYLADFGDLEAWDGAGAVEPLRAIVEEHRRFLGGLPFQRYVFLNAFRGGQGGLEHLSSCLLSSRPSPTEPLPGLRWLKYVSHEYFHAINVKRLRPIELGPPWDYERLPRTPSLWISEGLTTYYGDLAVVRSGVGSLEDHLAGLSGQIRSVQSSPGRLVQTLEEASLTVGTTSSSGVGGNRDSTVSYYSKGAVVGFLLDARIRRVSGGERSLDDLMRLAYARYSGERGFTAEEFEATAEEVAGAELDEFFERTLRSADELDYTEALDWFGLRFAEAAETERGWQLEVRPDATPEQRRNLRSLVEPSGD